MNTLIFYRASRWCYLHKLTPLAKVIYYLQFLLFHNCVPYTAEIGKGSKIPSKCTGIVIHRRAKIGRDCVIAQQVTVGGSSKKYDVPVIGDRVYLAPGAKVLGDVHIGDDVVVGSNAVVVKNVESNCVVGGVPAKVLKTGIRMSDYV